jgi:succinate dehydrogenase / fumarate reductase, membrane anchor subunit
MALARPKTLQQARATYSTNSELAWWVFMRVSGLALIFLTFGHLFMTNILVNAGHIDYAFITQRLSTTWVRIYDTFLLLLAMLHGGNGLRYSIEDYVQKPSRRFVWKMVLYVLVIAIMLYGIISLWAIAYAPPTTPSTH